MEKALHQLTEMYGELCLDVKNICKWCRKLAAGRIEIHMKISPNDQRRNRSSGKGAGHWIALIICPIVDCPSHTNNKIQSDSVVTNLGAKTNEKVIKPNIKLNKDKNNTKDNNNKNSTKVKEDNNSKPKNKPTGQEDFKAPTKFGRKCIEIPIEKVICTSSNKFAVLDTEEVMEVTPPKPKVKPIMMRINKNYNLILQEIYRTYPETTNKNTGNYIKIQPASAEDHENIKNLLVVKKADHCVIEEPKIIKAVIKGLSASTDVTDIESELKAKGVAVEKVAQLRRFATKAPLPLFMIEIKRSVGAEKIYDLKYLNYLTVEVVPFFVRNRASHSVLTVTTLIIRQKIAGWHSGV
ncbi:uncharacterized protein TNCV_625361 [Trichonephila clavipes]|nr:uncharacterized protein TNCV_625361 [Trichonephila clavipes]